MSRSRRFISNNPWVIPYITVAHRWLFRATGGRVGSRMGSTRLMMLNTVGRRSGQQRVTPLLYIEDGSRWIVVASNGGTERVPGWWFNLCELPDASIQLGRATHRVTARPATPEETAALWPKLDAAYEYFDDYRQRTKRELPVVILERRESGAVAAPAASDAAASPASGG